MTQKSHARQMRDAQKKAAAAELKGMQSDNTPIWDEIKSIHNNFVRLLNSNVVYVNYLNENKHLQPFFKEPGLVANYINILGRDHNEFVSRLNKIHEAHQDKSGDAKEHNDISLAIGLGNEYDLFGQQFAAVINPTIAHLTAYVKEAEAAYNEAQAVSDINVVTDVAFKEETTATTTE